MANQLSATAAAGGGAMARSHGGINIALALWHQPAKEI